MKYSSFCAANSGEGFTSFFDTLLDEKKRKIYYIKGGPGCGKSTLLKKIAAHADHAELIYCSGDPNSLDGVVLPAQQAVVIDATSPHSHEPHYPAVGGNIIDLGEGWNPDKMNAGLIMDLCDKKSEVYKNCYALLKSAKSIHEGVFKPLSKHISISKIQVLVNKILRQNALWDKRPHTAIVQKRYLSGISPDGCITLSNTFELLGKHIIVLEDRWMQSSLFLTHLDDKLTENGVHHINGYHPLLGPTTLQHIIIPECNLSIVSKDGIFPLNIQEENVIKKIQLQNIIEKEYIENQKNKLAFIKRLERELINLATEKLEEARSLHMKIEEEYGNGTDFEATAHLKEKLIYKLFGQT